MSDYMIRATAANGTMRAFAISGKDTVEKARVSHNTSAVVTAALGRTLMAGAMMSMMEKDEDNLLTIQFLGDGPIGGITVSADPKGLLKGFANNVNVDIPAKGPGKLDVGGAIGDGVLRIMRDTGAAEPYVGTVQLVSGEIAEDLTYYFAQSEQTPSAVGLGVLVNRDLSVNCAGGFIIQLMPDASDDDITRLENNIKEIPPVTEMMSDGLSPEDILKRILDGMDVSVLERRNVSFNCDCSKERVTKSIISLNADEIQSMIDDGKPIEVRCQFCNEKYEFSVEELKRLLNN